uniref:Immunoglobulin V-set domain-containing protein n=1 Tax=Callithrix jacchus TaxID=9483 RepID=A0A5F4WJU9_CALJA
MRWWRRRQVSAKGADENSSRITKEDSSRRCPAGDRGPLSVERDIYVGSLGDSRRLVVPQQTCQTPTTVATGGRALWVCTMSCTPVLLMLLVYCTGCGPQPVLHQPLAMSLALGTTVHLTFTLRNDYDISVYSVYWYQQRLGHPPRFLLRYFSQSDKSQGPQVPPRFSGSKDVARTGVSEHL